MPGPYELYFVRHGLAEERGDDWPDDAKRPLTEEGIVKLRKAAKGLVHLGVTLDVVLTSPLVRTRQTADIVSAVFDPRPPVVTSDGLAPGGSYQGVLADLEKQARRTRIALVGHEPGIGELAARFAGSRRPFEFKKGSMCRVDIDSLPPASPGSLRWFATTKMLGKLRK
jgi:phosphohistidine phosphatase